MEQHNDPINPHRKNEINGIELPIGNSPEVFSPELPKDLPQIPAEEFQRLEFEHQKNWAENQKYDRSQIYFPRSVEELREIVINSPKLKAIGSRHSFNKIANTHDKHVSLIRLDDILELDTQNMKVTVEGGIRYDKLSVALHRAGYALHNLASLPHISVAGACETSTHGSGITNGNLATAISAIEIMTADGQLLQFSRDHDGDLFNGVVVSLGALGIVTKLTLDIQPTYEVAQNVYENLPLSVAINNFDEIMSAAYSVSFFTTWQKDFIDQVWLKSLVSENMNYSKEDTFFGANAAAIKLHPIKAYNSINCTDQLGLPGPWYDRIPHFIIDGTPSSGDELQSEFIIARKDAPRALGKIRELAKILAPVLLISEVRTIASDSIWLSPNYKEDSVGIHFTWRRLPSAVNDAIVQVEEALSEFRPRPHWGKLTQMEPQIIRSLYPRFDDFKQLVNQLDPNGKFRNKFVEDLMFKPD